MKFQLLAKIPEQNLMFAPDPEMQLGTPPMRGRKMASVLVDSRKEKKRGNLQD